MSKYDDTWYALDPQTFAQRHGNRVIMARENYPLAGNTIENYRELVGVAIDFLNFLKKNSEGHNVDLSYNMALGEVVRLLRVESLEPFYDSCIRGLDGGVSGLLNKITEAYMREKEQGYVNAVIARTISDPLSYEEILGLMQEYVDKFGQFLPFQIRNINLLVHDWRQILLSHAKVLSSVRSKIGHI
jgi:hypothetical protein